MNETRGEDLLQGGLDGALDAADSSELQALLAADPAARDRSADLERLAALLDDLRRATAPPDLARGVMTRIAPLVVESDARRKALATGGGPMSKKIMWGLAAAAAVVLGVFAVKGFPPVDDTQGTIGAAKRYNAGQLGDQDVQVGDTTVQDFLQSDTFAAIVKDPDAVKLLSDPGLAKLLADPGFARNLADADFGRALSDPGLARALADPALARFFGDANLSRVLLSGDLQKALNDADFVARLKVNGDLARTLSDVELGAKLKLGSDLARALTDVDLAKALGDPALARLMLNADFQKSLSRPGVAKALSDQSLARALGDPAFGKVLLSGELGRALANPNFAQALSTSRLSVALKDASFASAFARLSGGFAATK
jgi:hypothetical protein